MALLAELGTLFGLMYWQRRTLPRNSWVAASLAVIGVVASFIPWFRVMLAHSHRSETSWIPHPNNISPLFQTLSNWLLIVIALPVENQPLWIVVPSGLLMILFGTWVGQHVFKGLRQLWRTPDQLATLTLLSFTFLVLLEFFAIVYLLGKDLTVVPRYNFVYYSSLCALIGASLVKCKSASNPVKQSYIQILGQDRQKAIKHNFYFLLFTFSFLSCVLVVSNLVFQKPFNPQLVAQNMNQEPSVPLMVVVGYNDYQDVALGLSFALALEKVRTESTSEFAFFKRSSGYEPIWQKLSQLPPPATSKLNLWVVAPGLRRRDYPPQLALSLHCTLDPTHYYRIGVPYQLYRCKR